MSELDREQQEQLFISAYWPRTRAGEEHVGYAMRKDHIFYRGLGAIFSILTSVFSLFFEPRVRPVVRPLLRLAPLFVLSAVIGILSNRGRKSIGFYQLDDQGRPVQFLSMQAPESIQGRLGVGRKKFLQQVYS